MKKLIYALLISGAVFCSCTNDETAYFDVTQPVSDLRFEPIPGGAVMHYTLPAHKDVMAIRVRYANQQGEGIVRTGSYACDSLVLVGFDQAQTAVEAEVTLCDRDNVESQPVKVTFDTHDSGSVIFLEKANIYSDWNRVTMTWSDIPEGTRGLVHVMYLGSSPFTHEQDTVMVGTYALSSGNGTLNFVPKQKGAHTFFLRAENFQGHTVGERVFSGVEAMEVDKLAATEFDFLDPHNLSIEDAAAKLGKQYLFDGDLRGGTGFPYMANNETKSLYYTFVAGPQAVGKPFIVDFREAKMVQQVKMYAMLYVRSMPYAYETAIPHATVWSGQYVNRLPCDVTVYGTNDKDNQSSWEKVGEYKDPVPTGVTGYPTQAVMAEYYKNRWCRYCVGNDEPVGDFTAWGKTFTKDDILAADPASFTVNIEATHGPYRYLVLVVEKLFKARYTYVDQNPNGYVTFHELEFLTQKTNE